MTQGRKGRYRCAVHVCVFLRSVCLCIRVCVLCICSTFAFFFPPQSVLCACLLFCQFYTQPVPGLFPDYVFAHTGD